MNEFYWWCSEWIEVLRDEPREFVDVEGVLACARYGYSLLLGEEFDEVYGLMYVSWDSLIGLIVM